LQFFLFQFPLSGSTMHLRSVLSVLICFFQFPLSGSTFFWRGETPAKAFNSLYRVLWLSHWWHIRGWWGSFNSLYRVHTYMWILGLAKQIDFQFPLSGSLVEGLYGLGIVNSFNSLYRVLHEELAWNVASIFFQFPLSGSLKKKEEEALKKPKHFQFPLSGSQVYSKRVNV